MACEIIIELGNKKYWDTKDMNFKKRMTSVFSKQVSDLELLVPNCKIASAIIHYDETSPHMHIVGVPIKYKSKNSMEKQVGKSDVFTKESLRKLQDKMRTLCIESFNQEYNLNDNLKAKKKGRNKDYNVFEMNHYQQMEEQLEKHQKRLDKANESLLELKKSSNDIKDIIKDLKTTIISKEKYVLKEEDKNKLIDYIDKVDKTNNEYQSIKELSITLIDVDTELKENREQIQILTENNDALSLRVDTLNNKLKTKDDEIKNLKEENNLLKDSFEVLQTLFNKLIKFLKNKMFSKKDKEKYYEFSVDLYTHGIINEDEIKDIKNKHNYSKEKETKHINDDIEL